MARIETRIDPCRSPSEIGESRGEPSTGPMATTTPLHRLQALGQSVWYDNIRRALLDRGRLRDYVEQYGVTGVTSNPSIFERAIADSSDYDEHAPERSPARRPGSRGPILGPGGPRHPGRSRRVAQRL